MLPKKILEFEYFASRISRGDPNAVGSMMTEEDWERFRRLRDRYEEDLRVRASLLCTLQAALHACLATRVRQSPNLADVAPSACGTPQLLLSAPEERCVLYSTRATLCAQPVGALSRREKHHPSCGS